MGMSNLSAAVVAGAMALGPGANAKNNQDLSDVSGPSGNVVDRSEIWRGQGTTELRAEPPRVGILSGVIPDNKPQTLVKPSLTPLQLVEDFAGKFKEAGYTLEKLPEGAGYWLRRGQEEIKISIGNPNDALGGAVEITQNGKPISLSIGLAAAEMREGKEVPVFILKFRDRETGKVTTVGKIEGAIQLATSENLGLGLLTTNVANGQSHQMFIPHQVGSTGGICIQPGTNVEGQAASNSICTQLQPLPQVNTSVSINPAPVHINPTSVNINPSVSGLQSGLTHTSVCLYNPSNVSGPSNSLGNQQQTGFGINLLGQPVWNYGPYLQQPLGPVHPSNVNVGPNAVTGHISADPSSTVNVGTNNLGVK
jgi:hypothetical protein